MSARVLGIVAMVLFLVLLAVLPQTRERSARWSPTCSVCCLNIDARCPNDPANTETYAAAGPARSTRRTNGPAATGRGAACASGSSATRFCFCCVWARWRFMTAAFALTWWVTGGVVPLALALASLVPAFVLFYLRDA